jgi:hypothetical protein
MRISLRPLCTDIIASFPTKHKYRTGCPRCFADRTRSHLLVQNRTCSGRIVSLPLKLKAQSRGRSTLPRRANLKHQPAGPEVLQAIPKGLPSSATPTATSSTKTTPARSRPCSSTPRHNAPSPKAAKPSSSGYRVRSNDFSRSWPEPRDWSPPPVGSPPFFAKSPGW